MGEPRTTIGMASVLFLLVAGGPAPSGPIPTALVPGQPTVLASPMGGSNADSQELRACELVTLDDAIRAIGAAAEHPGGDSDAGTCLYSNAGVAILTIQIGSAELYDQIRIREPHTPAQIGERGRHNVQPTGTVAVQFVKNDHTVTLGAQPIGTSASDLLDPLLAVARTAVDRIP